MTERKALARSTSSLSSSTIEPAAAASWSPTTGSSSSMRPRKSRLASNGALGSGSATFERDSGLLAGPLSSDGPSLTGPGAGRDPSPGSFGQFLGDSWSQGWSSVQSFASSLLTGADGHGRKGKGADRASSYGWGPQPNARQRRASPSRKNPAVSWGPLPPREPDLSDVAAGTMAGREAAVKAARKASLLQSHNGVNRAPDAPGKHKRRCSDDVAAMDPQPDDCLVYVHTVQPTDNYAGLILRYRCREDALRRANGLWSRDSLQTRKWLVIPVNACEIRGRPCDPPSWLNANKVDLLAQTPLADEEELAAGEERHHTKSNGVPKSPFDFFSKPVGETPGHAATEQPTQAEAEGRPWSHVRWVKIDSFPEPVEIGRVARQAMGYFPPRRRKSLATASSSSTPRQSADLSSGAGLSGSAEPRFSRRQSSLSSRAQLPGTPLSSRSRGVSEAADSRPAWMRRPGGVGSMGRSVREPGPDRDYFNTWAKKHIPGLNIEDMPSMSIMGSETAHFGFGPDGSNLAESPFDEGRDMTPTSRHGTGLDKAAAAVETWLRGAFSMHPGPPLTLGRGRTARAGAGDAEGDLIELADTGSDDGRLGVGHDLAANMVKSLSLSTSRRSDADGSVRGRTTGTKRKDQKAD